MERREPHTPGTKEARACSPACLVARSLSDLIAASRTPLLFSPADV